MKEINKSKKKRLPKFKIRSTKKILTSQAGLLPLIYFMKKINFDSCFKKSVELERGVNTIYSLFDIIYKIIIGICGGAQSIDKAIYLNKDNTLRMISSDDPIPNPSTVSRVLQCITQRHAHEFRSFIHLLRTKAWSIAERQSVFPQASSKRYIVDIDSTARSVFGKQEGVCKGYNPSKKSQPCYNGQLAFLYETKEILQGNLRPGNTHSINNMVGFLKELWSKIKDLNVLFRMDRGYFSEEVISYIEQINQKYLIKVKLPNIHELKDIAKWERDDTDKNRYICEFGYRCKSWSKFRRIVGVKVKKDKLDNSPKIISRNGNQLQLFNELMVDEDSDKNYYYFFYVTNLSSNSSEVHDLYGDRMTCETWIEESKNQVNLAGFHTNSFWANEILYQLTIISYNLFKWMALISNNKTLIKWEIKSVRTYIIRTAGLLVSKNNSYILEIPEDDYRKKCWLSWIRVGMT